LPPYGSRITIGAVTRPWLRNRSRDAWLMIWSNAGNTKPSNWISQTGT